MNVIIKELKAKIADVEKIKSRHIREAEVIKAERKCYAEIKELIELLTEKGEEDGKSI